GCIISNLYDALLPHGKIIPGGSCGTVALAGLTLGGGYGLTARQYGLTCDSLVEVTMVDGTGTIRNSKDEPELLWACKGGGNGNFGVVTELKFKVHKAPKTMQSFRFKTHKVNTAKAKEILQNWFEATAQLPKSCFSAYVLNGKTVYILLTNIAAETVAIKQITEKLSALADKTTKTRPQPIASALKTFYGLKEPQFFKNASAGLYRSFDEIEPCIDKVISKVISTSGMIYQVNTLGGNIMLDEFRKTSSFPYRDYPYFSELQTYWQTETQGTHMMQRFEEIEKMFLDIGIKAQYQNYPSVGFQHWEEMYYGDNDSLLQRIKNKYDPANLIRHEQSVRNI
ncbi:MAG TPA: BBE domain-containing protein, partial [Ferruginibacter sp.]|nr:BBE domain-containing protein [Ferruginibacter sp.]